MLDFIFLINFLLFFTFCLFFFKRNLLSMLLVAEFVWVFFFLSISLSGFCLDSVPLLALTLFSLTVAGLEFGLGILLYFLY